MVIITHRSPRDPITIAPVGLKANQVKKAGNKKNKVFIGDDYTRDIKDQYWPMLYSVSPIANLDYSKREDRGAGEFCPG